MVEDVPTDVVMLADSPDACIPTALGYNALPKPFQLAILSKSPAATLARTVSVLKDKAVISEKAKLIQIRSAKHRQRQPDLQVARARGACLHLSINNTER